MIDALVLVVVVALGALAVYGLVTTVLNRPPDRWTRLAVAGVVALLAVQAAIAAVRVFSGVELPETSTFLIYLVVSVCVLPIATQFATAADSELRNRGWQNSSPGRWQLVARQSGTPTR